MTAATICYTVTMLAYDCCRALISLSSLSVNINCAGYSDPFPLVLQYDDEGYMYPFFEIN